MLNGAVKDICWTADGERIAIVGEGSQTFGKVIMWDTGANVGEITGFAKRLISADFRPNRPFKLAIGGDEMQLGFFAGPPFKLAKQ